MNEQYRLVALRGYKPDRRNDRENAVPCIFCYSPTHYHDRLCQVCHDSQYLPTTLETSNG